MTKDLLNQLPETVREKVQASFDDVEKERDQLHLENRLLREELRLLKAYRFGRSSEQGASGQVDWLEGTELENPEPEPAVAETVVAKKKKKLRPNHPGRHPFPEHLERVVETVEPTEEERTCDHCGGEKEVIDEVVRNELEEVPAVLRVREFHLKVCQCPKCKDKPITAEGPSRLIPESVAGPSIWSRVIVDKFADHQPLYRQEQRFKREGVYLSRKTTSGWLRQLAPTLGRLTDLLREDVIGGGYIQSDDTPIPVQNKQKPGKNDQDYFWIYHRPGGSVYIDFQATRSRAGPAAMLEKFDGILQSDGYQAYLKVGRNVMRVACMAHIRREFWNALKTGDERAHKTVLAINRLYKIERLARQEGLDAQARYELRQNRSVKRMALLKERILRLAQEALPKSTLGKACTYALGQWASMENYLQDGRIEIDNNLAENIVRPLKLGCKNWLHIGSECAGEWAAVYMTLMANCLREQVNPKEYFTDILTRLPDHDQTRLSELLPKQWKASREAENPAESSQE
jgi:transposase